MINTINLILRSNFEIIAWALPVCFLAGLCFSILYFKIDKKKNKSSLKFLFISFFVISFLFVSLFLLAFTFLPPDYDGDALFLRQNPSALPTLILLSFPTLGISTGLYGTLGSLAGIYLKKRNRKK